MAAGDLTVLADAKLWLGIVPNTDDATLTRLITAASVFVANYVGRSIPSQAYVERRNGSGGRVMVTKNRPITAVSSLVIDSKSIPLSADNAVLQSGYGFDDSKIWLVGYSFSHAIGNVVLSYTAGYTTVPLDVAQACIDLVALKYRGKGRIGETSKNINGMVVSYSTKDMTDEIRVVLDNYKQVAIV